MAGTDYPRRIHKLPDNLVNRIAAGEVIERPASVVKELLENSLDAGASNITLEINAGGTRLVRVLDNGHGIHATDLLLAVDRHATSKLHGDSDLSRIVTLGFRGEALSSIASVSRLKLTSRQTTVAHGWSIETPAAGRDSEPQPAAHPVGTTVEVRELFYNTPARRKFLRTEKTEFIHIQELVKRIALSRFNLAMRFVHNGRQVLMLPDHGDNPAQRVKTLFGKQFFEQCRVVEQQRDGLTLYGWVGLPEIARSQTDQQYFYLNGRIIRDKLINHAVRLAYEDKLYPGRHPAYLLYLEMDPAAADINVHPTKHEVRFRDARGVHDFIYGCLAGLLSEKRPVTRLDGGHAVGRLPAGSARFSATGTIREPQASYEDIPANRLAGDGKYGTPVTHIEGRFIIAKHPTGMVLLDAYRARELIARCRLENEYQAGGIKSRPVLVPLMLPLAPETTDFIQHPAWFEKLGLELQQIAPTALQIRALPLVLPHADALALVKDVINTITLSKLPAQLSAEAVEKLLRVMAQHANDCAPLYLNVQEMNLLWKEFVVFGDQLASAEFGGAMRSFDIEALRELMNGKI